MVQAIPVKPPYSEGLIGCDERKFNAAARNWVAFSLSSNPARER